MANNNVSHWMSYLYFVLLFLCDLFVSVRYALILSTGVTLAAGGVLVFVISTFLIGAVLLSVMYRKADSYMRWSAVAAGVPNTLFAIVILSIVLALL